MQLESSVQNPRYTFTVDASFNRLEEKIGIGILIQESGWPGRRGAIIDELAETHSAGSVLQKEMELFAIFRALEIAAGRAYGRIHVRSDCNQLRRLLNEDLKRKSVQSESSLRTRIFHLAQTFDEVRFAYCPRRKNQTAHRLARKGALIKPKSRLDDEEPQLASLWRMIEFEQERMDTEPNGLTCEPEAF